MRYAKLRDIIWVLMLACALTLSACGDVGEGDSGGIAEPNYNNSNVSNTNSGTTSWSGNGATSTNNTGGADAGGWNNNGVSTNNSTTGTGNSTNGGTTSTNNGTTGGNSNVNLGGEQDFGYFRRLIEDGQVPPSDAIDASGFFAEHHTPLPNPDCGERICVQAMLGVMGNLMNGEPCTLLQVGLNSPIVADPSQRPPLTLALVIDVSGSMADRGKMEFVRDGLATLVNTLNDDDQVALIVYSDDARVTFPMQEVRGNRNTLMDAIEALRADGATNLYSGLELGYRSVLDSFDSGRQNRVILLSDGQPTRGEVNPSEIEQMSGSFNSEGIGLTTIGLGTDFNRALMRDLALRGDGNHYFVENAGAVDEVFEEELSYFTVPIAYDLELDLTTGADYTFGRAMGTPLWENTDGGGRMSIPSVFLAHRESHDDVTDDNGRRGGGSALLIELMPRDDDGSTPDRATVSEIQLKFREPGTDEIIDQSVLVEYPMSPWEILAQGFFETVIVEKSFVMLNILVAFQSACDMFHDGEGDEAISLLRRVAAAAADYEDSANEGQGDVDIRLDIELMDQLISVMIQNGATDPDAPIPDDPWPAD